MSRKICALSGRKAQSGRNRRHRHSGAWALRAPKTPRRFQVNLQKVTVPLQGGGKARVYVAARMLTSRRFKALIAGEKPLPKRAAR